MLNIIGILIILCITTLIVLLIKGMRNDQKNYRDFISRQKKEDQERELEHRKNIEKLDYEIEQNKFILEYLESDLKGL